MATILHVTKTGHKCHRPIYRSFPASYIIAGEILQLGDWILFCRYAQEYGCRKTNIRYILRRFDFAGDDYEFSNFNCAVAKLAELGA